MGVSTNGQICWGFKFEEGEVDFPWDDDKYDGEIESWWRDVNGYVNPKFDPFDADGNYKPEVVTYKDRFGRINSDDPRIDEYFAHQREWDKANPVPVELVNYCSGDCPMYILAVPESVLTNRRGYPEVFDPAQLNVTPEQQQALRDFCDKYEIETPEEPLWWLSSYWG